MMNASIKEDSVFDRVLESAYGTADQSPQRASPTGDPDRFEVLSKLGTGGMGEVFVARDRVLGRRVALKVIRSELRINKQARSRFLREARILSRFEHPNLCRLFDFVQRPTSEVLVMELIDGQTLHDHLELGLDRKSALEIAIGIARGLTVAHGAGIVHRDLKPANVMVTPDGTAKLLDFGIARALVGEAPDAIEPSCADAGEGSLHTGATANGQVIGTPRFMSPEQTRGEEAVAASDLYSFGLILERLLGTDPRAKNRRSARHGHIGRDLAALIGDLQSEEPTDRPTAAQVCIVLMKEQAKPRRLIIQSLVLAVALAFGALSIKYVLDLGRERDRVVNRQHQGEQLIDFLVGTVADRIEDVGPKELIAELDRQALDYFKRAPLDELSDLELRRHVQALAGFGQRVQDHGRMSEAMAIYEEEVRFLEDRLQRAPGDPEWLFELAQAKFYMGKILRDQHDTEGASRLWRDYESLALRLVARDPENLVYRDELAYAGTNLGVLQLEAGRSDLALASLQPALAHWAQRADASPGELAPSLELIDVLSWVAEARVQAGDLTGAQVDFGREVRAREELCARDPENVTFVHGLALAHFHNAQALDRLGELEFARVELDHAHTHARNLHDLDPDSGEWVRTLALISSTQAVLLDDLGLLGEARLGHLNACELMSSLIERDPSNADWSLLERTFTLASAWNLASLDLREESSLLVEKVLLGCAAANKASLLEVEALLLLGDLQPAGEPDWTRAVDLLVETREAGLDREPGRSARALEVRLSLRLGHYEQVRRLAYEAASDGELSHRSLRELHERGVSIENVMMNEKRQ